MVNLSNNNDQLTPAGPAGPQRSYVTSTAETAYGIPLTVSGQFLGIEESLAKDFLLKIRGRLFSWHPTRPVPSQAEVDAQPKGLMEPAFVYIQRDGNKPPVAQVYEGPYGVFKVGPKVFIIQRGWLEERLSIDHLKPHVGRDPMEAAMLAKRPRLLLSSETGGYHVALWTCSFKYMELSINLRERGVKNPRNFYRAIKAVNS